MVFGQLRDRNHLVCSISGFDQMVALTILIWMKTSYVECADHTIWYAVTHNGSGNAEIFNL